MEIIRDNRKIEYKTVVALGNFDGLHKAHMQVIKNCVGCARDNGYKSGVLLFGTHTLNTLSGSFEKLLTDEAEKLNILEKSGVDFVYIIDFDERFMRLTPIEFADELSDKLNAKTVCVGYDYRFGHKAAGDIHLLKELGQERGFLVSVTDEISADGVTVKSTKIRELIESGDVAGANKLLGRNFSISGEVLHGFCNGTKMGVPTANVDYGQNIILPRNGVYCGYTQVCGNKHKSVINIGNNPTFDADKITLESHLLDFDGDLYGQNIRVEFVEKIRDDKKFSGIDELKEQIFSDIEVARNILREI